MIVRFPSRAKMEANNRRPKPLTRKSFGVEISDNHIVSSIFYLEFSR